MSAEELRNSLPDPNAADEIVTNVGLAALSSVPIVGPFIAGLTQSAVSHRAAVRQADFDHLVVLELNDLGGRVDGITAESILESDAFMAAYSKAARAAAETASSEKRERLARALSRMGPWVTLDEARKQLLFNLVARYDDLHFQLLDYFSNPVEWIQRENPEWQPDATGMGGITGPMNLFLFPGVPNWEATVHPIVAEMEGDQTMSVPLNSSMSSAGTVQKRTSSLGDALLEFVRSPQ